MNNNNDRQRIYAIALGAALLIASISASADPISDLEEELNERLPYEERIAGWVDNTARAIDAFFGNEDAWRIDNESWLRLTTDMRWDTQEQGSVDASPRLRLDLPTAKEELHLLIENDSLEERSAAEEAVPALRQGDESKSASVGFGLDLDNWAKDWKKQFQVGIRGALPLNPYTRFIAKRKWDLPGEWELASHNLLAWFNRDGYSWKSQIRVGEPIAPDWRMDFATNLQWQEEDDFLEYSQRVTFSNVLSDRSAISYSTGVTAASSSDPRIEAYFLLADYRRNISRRLVFIDVIPALTFPREEDYDPQWSITVRLELYFQKHLSRHN
jgi:hypothetical protein